MTGLHSINFWWLKVNVLWSKWDTVTNVMVSKPYGIWWMHCCILKDRLLIGMWVDAVSLCQLSIVLFCITCKFLQLSKWNIPLLLLPKPRKVSTSEIRFLIFMVATLILWSNDVKSCPHSIVTTASLTLYLLCYTCNFQLNIFLQG